MTISNVLGKTCVACGQERRKKDMIAYSSETFEPYCHTPYICNDEHPNSPKNLIKNQMETKLLSYDEAREAYNVWIEKTQDNPERHKKIRRMVENPMTIRIGDADLAKFILDLQDDMEFHSISDTIKYCIQNTMDQKGNFVTKTVKIEKQITENNNVKEVETNPIPDSEELKQEETDEMVFDF
jgi:hypothetical protein